MVRGWDFDFSVLLSGLGELFGVEVRFRLVVWSNDEIQAYGFFVRVAFKVGGGFYIPHVVGDLVDLEDQFCRCGSGVGAFEIADDE